MVKKLLEYFMKKSLQKINQKDFKAEKVSKKAQIVSYVEILW